jgi:nitrite reductase/ring-hydroxylating ferredoxin subunit
MNSENQDFARICSITDLKEKEGKKFFIEDNEIAVFRVAEKVYALSNHCPHQHSANIYDGFIEDGCVVCPAHGWMFDLKTGKTPAGRKGLESYETKVINSDVYIRFTDKEWKW